MARPRATAAASACAFVLLAGCEQHVTPAPALAPSPAIHATGASAAVGAPAAEVQRASAVLAARVSGWERPQAHGPAPVPARVAPVVDAAAFAGTVTPENLPDVARALDRPLRAATPGKPAPR